MDQLSFKKNNSNLIKQSEKSKKQAMRRLTGSIFLLLLALILLLNVTTKTKPISVTPQTVEIKHNSNSVVAANTISTESDNLPITVAPSTIPVTIESENIIAQDFVELKTIASTNITNHSKKSNKTSFKTLFKGQIIEEKAKISDNPEDILNNISLNNNVYFIQLAALNDKNKLKHIQQQLANNNIKSFIDPIKTNKNKMYRLRIGPFKLKENAINKLNEINNLTISNNF